MDRHEQCPDCGAPLEPAQRYCLGCGKRVGGRSAELLALLARLHGRPGAMPAPLPVAVAWAPPVEAGPPERLARPGLPGGLTLPPPRFSALLVLLFLGFGVLLGGAARSSVKDTLAASARPSMRLVIPAAASASASPASSASAYSQPSLPEETSTPGGGASPAPTLTAERPGSAKAPAAPATPEAGSGEPAGSGSSGSHSGAAAARLPAIKHVFVIMLSDQPYAAVFGPASTAPYLSQTLERRGALLAHYDAVAHEHLANGIALLSGQGPTASTAANCPSYTDIVPSGVAAEQQVLGSGCVYPAATQTLAGQLAARRLSWRAYVQGMDEGPTQPPACGHPAPGASDPTAAGPSAPGYATYRNPLVYFHSLIDSPACAANDVGLDKLGADLSGSPRSFSYIVPDRCHDGSATPCSPGAPAGVAAADALLRKVVPQIMASRAYKDRGLLVITVDEAPSSGEFGDSSSCCGQPRFPNLPAPRTGLSGRGGGAVGALLLSPFVKGGTTSQEPYNHFSLLRTIEDLFALRHLGYAAASGVSSFEASLFTAHVSH